MIARPILRKVFEGIGPRGLPTTLRVEFANGSVYQNFDGDGEADALIRFRTARSEWYSLVMFYEGLFECYIDQQVDIEGKQPITAIALMGHRIGMTPTSIWGRMLVNPINAVRQVIQERRQDNTDRTTAMRNADFHYALHPALFENMLGETVGYSEGMWPPGTETLNQAKYNNYEYVCRKLRLAPGQKVLEVGSGWGYMPIYMARRYDVDVTVYNPVERQNDYMRERFARHGLADRIRLIGGDHRDIAAEAGAFDRFVSIGVHEHAGYRPRQYDLWARSIAAALKEGGVGVVSTTSFMRRQMTNRLTLRYIFPGGHLPSLPGTLAAFNRAGLTLVEVENLWPHYQRTIQAWRDNFGRLWPEISKADPAVFDEAFRRRWIMYLEGTVEVFRDALDLSHIVFTKGRDAAYYPNLPAVKTAAEFIGGDTEPECYR
jgi:cyclopropane-fatty-acyl-phospholipid synthase